MSISVNCHGNATDLIKNKLLLHLPVNLLKESAAEFSKDKKCKV